jgi:hypothetical protein
VDSVRGHWALSLLNLSPVADAQKENYKPLVLECADEAIVAAPLSPKLSQWTLEGFADLSRIVELLNSFIEEPKDSLADGFVKLVQLFLHDR